MNELLKDKLRVLASDEIMLKALQVAVEERIERNKPSINPSDNDTVLGQKYRAAENARILIEGVLADISSYKGQNLTNKFNKGK